MPTLTLSLPRRLDWQEQVNVEAKRFNVVDVGRRAGKTLFGLDRCAQADVLMYPVGWFSPTYKMLQEVWRSAVETFYPITVRKNASEHRIEFVTGGLLEFWSLDKPDTARGRRYKRIVVDEAAMVADLMGAWNYVLRPTLADWAGDAYFLSTPKGRNGFWHMYQMGIDAENGEWAAWQMSSMVNPKVPPEEFEAMRRTMPERIYSQEILAQFIDDAGGVFRNVMGCATATEIGQADGSDYLFGVDFGKHNDFTVIAVLDMRTKQMVYMDRFNQIDYTVQVGRLQALAERFKPNSIIAERNSMGDPLIEDLQRRGLPVRPFTTTHASKSQAIDALALAFERKEISILNDPTLIGELQAYEMERLPSGTFRYNAPSGMHDDTVMALALAWSGIGRGWLFV